MIYLKTVICIKHYSKINQITHSRLAHKMSTNSAKNLSERYSNINIQETTKNLIEAIKNSPDSHEKSVALQYFINQRGICHENGHIYDYKDPDSGISIKQLVALAYAAISDERTRIGLYQDALKVLIEGFSEMFFGQLYPQGIQQHICSSGAFNKIIEKLTGIHPDVQLTVTKEMASLKLSSLIIEEACLYIDKIKHLFKTTDLTNLKEEIASKGLITIQRHIIHNIECTVNLDYGLLWEDKKEIDQILQQSIEFCDSTKVLKQLEDIIANRSTPPKLLAPEKLPSHITTLGLFSASNRKYNLSTNASRLSK